MTTLVKSDFKELKTGQALETLRNLNPGLEMNSRKLAHFGYGFGVVISTESFFTNAMINGKGLILPEGWVVKNQPGTNTYQLLIPGEEILFIRVSDKTK